MVNCAVSGFSFIQSDRPTGDERRGKQTKRQSNDVMYLVSDKKGVIVFPTFATEELHNGCEPQWFP